MFIAMSIPGNSTLNEFLQIFDASGIITINLLRSITQKALSRLSPDSALLLYTLNRYSKS